MGEAPEEAAAPAGKQNDTRGRFCCVIGMWKEVKHMRKWHTAAAIFAMIIGFTMIIMWAVFYITGAIPEIQFKPGEIYLHMTAEMITALLLITGGYGLIKQKVWGRQVYLLSLGMLVYSVISSSGYYVQRGNHSFTIMFGVILLMSILFAAREITDN